MATYNGHKNYNYWNVSLCLFNDEGPYRMVVWHIKQAKNKNEAARRILAELPDTTPDGVRFTFSSVRAAIRGEV